MSRPSEPFNYRIDARAHFSCPAIIPTFPPPPPSPTGAFSPAPAAANSPDRPSFAPRVARNKRDRQPKIVAAWQRACFRPPLGFPQPRVCIEPTPRG